jgi:hypothetical protein
MPTQSKINSPITKHNIIHFNDPVSSGCVKGDGTVLNSLKAFQLNLLAPRTVSRKDRIMCEYPEKH